MIIYRTIAKLGRYLRTYWFLVLGLVGYAKVTAPILIFFTIVLGALYPLPIAMFGVILGNYIDGRTTVEFKIGELFFTSSFNIAVFTTLSFAVLIFVTSYINQRSLLKLVLAWQLHLLKQFMENLPHYSDISARRDVLPESERQLTSIICRSIRSTLMVERLLSTGLYQLAALVISSALVVFFSPILGLFLALVSIAFAPIYARILVHMLSNRANRSREAAKVRPKLEDLLKQVIKNKNVREHKLEQNKFRIFAPLFSGPTWQILSLNSIRVVGMIHALALVAIIIWRSSEGLGLDSAQALLLFVSLFILLRCMISLINLMARIARSYTTTAALARIFYPTKRKLKQSSTCLSKISGLSIGADTSMHQSRTIPVLLGDYEVVKYSYQLAPISNHAFMEYLPNQNGPISLCFQLPGAQDSSNFKQLENIRIYNLSDWIAAKNSTNSSDSTNYVVFGYGSGLETAKKHFGLKHPVLYFPKSGTPTNTNIDLAIQAVKSDNLSRTPILRSNYEEDDDD